MALPCRVLSASNAGIKAGPGGKGKRMKPAHVTGLEEYGCAVVPKFLTSREVATLRAAVDQVYAEAMKHRCTFRHRNLAYEILNDPGAGKKTVLQSYWASWVNPELEAQRRHPRYLEVLEPLLGCNIKQMADQIHWKEPGGKYTFYRYHQDIRFRPRADLFDDIERNSITTGLALEFQDDSNGTLRVFPGSHKLGRLSLAQDAPSVMNEMTQRTELLAAGLNPDDALPVVLEPGDLVIWTLTTVHGSGANTSTRNRPFLLNSYVRAESAPTRGEWVFRDGVSTPLGDEPQICKLENLADYDQPTYDETDWTGEG